MRQLHVHFPQRQLDELKEKKEQTGCSLAGMIRLAVDKWLEENP